MARKGKRGAFEGPPELPEEFAASGDAEFRARSDRVALLVERSLLWEDVPARNEIIEMLEPIAARLVGGIDDLHERDAVLNKVMFKAWVAMKSHRRHRKDVLLAYVIVSMRNAALDEYRRLARRHESDVAPLDVEVADGVAHAATDDLHVRRGLEKFLADARLSGTANDVKVAEVLVVQYLFGETAAEACDRLVYSPEEKKTVTEKMSRQRTDPQSPLCRLAEEILDIQVRPNQKRARRTRNEEDQ